ncbi:hypothetical protein Taro_039967, partial [Colocasia esculenta]|nr:hypothetical protein [Colocasia esculenta]
EVFITEELSTGSEEADASARQNADVDSRSACLKFKTDQAQDAKKMEKLNNIFFTLMARGPDADLTEASSKEQADQQPSKKGRGRRQ